MTILTTPIDRKIIKQLRVGDEVLLSGTIYTARDQAHKRLVGLIDGNRKLPFDLEGKIIYYSGPTQTPEGMVIGSCGPTTSSRMDEFSEKLLKKGLSGFIGKGRRSEKVKDLIKKYNAIYFLAPSGCGALLAEKVVAKEMVAFAGLGPEAIYKLKVKDFPLIAGVDSLGNDIYKDI